MRGRFLRHLRRKLATAAIAALSLGAGIAACNLVVLRGGGARATPLAADTILVLGAGVLPNGAPSHVLEDRLATALALFRERRAPRILVSGDRSGPEYDEPACMREWLEARGVPASAIVDDPAGFDTFSSVARAKTRFAAASVIVVTQAFHLPRALWVARSLGLDADGTAADRRRYEGAPWFAARELLSRTKAVLDVLRGREA